MDIKKQTELLKNASKKIADLNAQLKKANDKLAVKSKFASLKGRKKAEVAEEVAAEVKDKLTEAGVPEEAVQEAVEIVETAVAEAEVQGDTEMAEEVLDEDTKAELTELATSDDVSEEVKLAALKFVENCKQKQAFGRELLNVVKKLSAQRSYTGSVSRGNGRGVSGGDTPALSGLKAFIIKNS